MLIEFWTALLAATIIVGGMLLTLAVLIALISILPAPIKRRRHQHGNDKSKHSRG
ncbi:MAG: hypothetical protein VW405_03810 [Rhodospirillaceae bacterium]